MPPQLIITLATKNEGKRLELNRWLQENAGHGIELAINPDAPDVDETGRDFIENAILKARLSPPVKGSKLVLAEDSGMVVDALDGSYGISPFPGIYSHRWLTPAVRDELLGGSLPNRMPLDRTTEEGVTNSDLCGAILKLMEGKKDRAARYCCGMALWHVECGLLFKTLTSSELEIIEGEPQGVNGFGYDPITRPLDYHRTMAELSPVEKNSISHRGKAFRQTLDFISSGSAATASN